MIKKHFCLSLISVLGIGITLFLTYGPAAAKQPFSDVCPPFFLRDDLGAPINPVTGENTAVPYSPKQTCGTAGCHNYKKITEGYHFQQGKDEKPNKNLTALYQWVLSPGQYGGRW